MRAALTALTTVVMLCLPVLAQSSRDAAPQFEVASVKPNKSGETGLGLDVQPGGRFVATNIPLRQLIRAAYTLQLYQIAGAPSWVESERFDITALAGRDITVTVPWTPGGKFALVQLLLQSLLADRFKMVAHTEMRESAVYALVLNQPERDPREKLRVANADCMSDCGMHIAPGSLRARRVPLRQVAEFLSQVTGRLVTDATALDGNFDLDFTWNPDLQSSTADLPSIFTALQEQLGLRLESRREPIPTLVIDSIQRPTPD